MFTKVKTSKGYVYRANFCDEMKRCSNWAFKTAYNKANYTFDSWQKRPNKYSKFVDIYYGDFAKNIVKSFLLEMNPKLEIEEYDEIRTDDFKEHDLFDLRLKGKKIEVKSSLEKYLNNLDSIYNDRRIIINVNGYHQTLSDFVVQVFFIPIDLKHYEKIEDDNKANPNITDEVVINKCKEEVVYSVKNSLIYVMGWIDKQQEQNAIEKAKKSNGFGVINPNSNAEYRTYANIMICNSNELDKLVQELTKIQESDN